MVTRGTWGSTCWDLWPRYTGAQQRERGLTHQGGDAKRRAELARLARKRNAPGLLAYYGTEPVGWVSIGPRVDYAALDASRATPPVDEVRVWVIPCITVRKGYRGRGLAIALLRAAAEYAGKRGAPAVEGYPRADNIRRHDDYAFYGTKAMFLKAGFRQIRGVLRNMPKTWAPRVTMRRSTSRLRGSSGQSGGRRRPRP